ncbi:MAG: ABC transporter ATP-binding protein [Treponema sp.]|jgi:putative ABC transport system ATP-binding protein|nr:ABC transporter ATP-binding protein [Treponema sp.]
MNIEVSNLTKEYIQGGEPFNALNNVNLSISSGQFYCITGRSGSGKSTLMNIIAGLTIPTSGSVYLDGQDIFALSDKELSLYRNSKIGFVPQGVSILSSLEVIDNVRLPFYLSKREGDSTKEAYNLLKLVGIEKLAGSMPRQLSGGQLKRVAIARALINKPAFLLADEPTGDLDVQTTSELLKIFRKTADEGTAVLMITHEPDTMQFADKRYDMKSGVLTQV